MNINILLWQTGDQESLQETTMSYVFTS